MKCDGMFIEEDYLMHVEMEEDLLETDIYHHALNLKNQWEDQQTFITLENLNLLRKGFNAV